MKKFVRTYVTKESHIDFQGIMDGLYYPFYMEECRHEYIEEVLLFDMRGNSDAGINMVISEYTIKFLRPLKANDKFDVTCSAYRKPESDTKLLFEQEISINDKVFTKGIFTVTCVPSDGGRPFLPKSIIDILS